MKVQTFSITFNTIFEGTENQNDDEFQCFLAQIHYFEKLEVECSPYFKGVKGRLAKHLEFWIKIEGSDFVMDTIRNGYVIPILNPPNSMFMKNNKSALKKAICDLIDSGCAYEVPFKPFIVNPLTVATNKSGNMRLILDLSVLNKFVNKEKF